MDDSKGNAKRKVLVVEDNEPNKKSCPHAMKGDGRSAATPIGRLLNASSEPGSPTKDAKLHLSNGVDASAQGPNVPAHRDLSPRVAGLHTEPGDEGDEAEGQFDVEPHPHPVEDEMTAETASNDGGTIEVPRGTERLRTEILAHPWKHLISTDDGILRLNANYPTGFGNPYVALTLTHECHKRLYWLLSVSEDALIAADRLNAFIWPKHEVAPKYVNDREHQAAIEFFRIMPNELIQSMRNEARGIVDHWHGQTLMWLQCHLAAEGLTQFEASTMLRRSAASRATTQFRRRENISMDLVNPYDVDELLVSSMDTDSKEYLKPQACVLDKLDRYNRLYIERVRVVKESQGRRAKAQVPQLSNVAVTTITRLKTVRTPGWSQESHFSMAYQTPDEQLGWLARENEANELKGKWYYAHDVDPRAEHGIHRGSQLSGWEIDPGARETMVEFPDHDVRPLCHDGCTRALSEQSKAVQPDFGRSQL